MRTFRRMVSGGAAALALAAIVVVNVFPFVYMVAMSFRSTVNAANFSLSPEGFTLEQYQKIFALDGFGRFAFNSVFVAVAGVVLAVAVCALAGYAFARMDFPGNDRLFAAMVLTLVVPSEVILVPLFLIVKGLGWLNTYWALIMPLPTAFGVFIMRQAFLGIPQDIFDAARIDGCGDLRMFFQMALPLAKSSILALSIFTFVGAWNNFTWPSVASTDAAMKTLPLALSMMKTQYNSDVGLTMACAVINFLPPFLFYLVLQNRFKEGMTLNGMKG